jgi:hypothetical protein
MAIWVFLVVFSLFSPGSTVIFMVEDSQGTPIEGADVSFCARYGTTDAQGMVTFEEIPDLSNTPYGGCTLSIQKEGYTPVQDAFSVTGDMVLTYILYSDIMATFSGTVYFDSSQSPAAFTAIRIYDALTDAQLLSMVTDAQGRFSFEMPIDRSLYTIVSDYDDQTFFLSAEKDQVLIVNTRGIRSMVSVSVRDPDKRPIPGAHVTLSSGHISYKGTTDEKGTILFEDVTNGIYSITVEKEAYVLVTQTLTLTVPEEGGIQEVNITLEQAMGTLDLEIHTVSASSLPARILITQEDVEIVRLTGTEQKQVPLQPGLYAVEVSVPGYTSVKRQVLILEGQTHSVTIELEKTQRTVQVITRENSYTGILLVMGAVGGMGGLFIWWRYRRSHSSS